MNFFMADIYNMTTRALLLVSYDNGGVNRNRMEWQVKREIEDYLKTVDQDILFEVEEWFKSIPEQQIESICFGEELEAKHALRNSPVGTAELLDRWYHDYG